MALRSTTFPSRLFPTVINGNGGGSGPGSGGQTIHRRERAAESKISGESEIEGLRRQVADLQDQLDRAERLATLGAMSGAVAHELNNMLTPLLSYAGLALSNPDDPALARKALERTLQTAERVGEVTASLLRSTAASARGEDHRCHLRRAVEDAIRSMPRKPHRDGVEVLIDIDPGLEARISHGAMQQVAMNLIINACDAMRPGPGTLAFSACIKVNNTKQTSKNIGKILLRVADTGPGMAEHMVEHAFEPLVTTKGAEANACRTRSGSGSGLGLTICRKLITQAGGEITVRSEPGLGTCFSIRLGRAQPEVRLADAA